ncbi:LysE family translocator [Solicola gregarius]|uniref:LysE family translocator n=1 Tax=Solicola gregarius TaxID=2908642 RepID=A0AA46TKQ7_9ACTN|nr:LysE family translocator [Solicola gregarius]UYM06692.1 LysE family translocator [Solicola gregarius]
MDMLTLLPSFAIAVALISASPGPAMVLIIRRASLRGFGSAAATILGLELGIYVWALLAAAGFAALVAASEVAYLALRVVGAGVLLFLGVRALGTAWRERRLDDARDLVDDSPDRSRGVLGAVAEGLMVQLANPKAAVFMVAFYPQFIPADRPLFATTAWLGLLQVAIELVLYLSLAAGVARVGAWFRRSTVRRRMEAISGVVLIGLGLRVAVSSR